MGEKQEVEWLNLSLEQTEETQEQGLVVEMSGVWQKLPEELQTKVAEEHLPIRSLCRFRCVSRSWSKPRLRPAALSGLHGLHIHRKLTMDGCIFSLRFRKRPLHVLKRGPRSLGRDTFCLDCINGLFGCAFSPLIPRPGPPPPVHFQICNIFTASWTELHPPTPTSDRDPLFMGMSKIPVGDGDYPRIGDYADATLGDGYILVAGMVDYDEALDRATDMLLQVYKNGFWSSSLFRFPDGYALMYNDTGMEKCGVLRGSIFFFLLMRLDFASASLACIDLLTSDKRCTTLCELKHEFVTKWEVITPEHPKLAVCSGKLLLVCGRQVAGKKNVYTACIHAFDEDKSVWKYVSSLPEELRGNASFRPHGISHGGDELVVVDNNNRKSFIYSLVTGAWSCSCNTSANATPDVMPISLIY